MRRILFFLLLSLLASGNVNAGCDDSLADGVDYTNCRFSDGQDLQGSYLPNSNLSFAGFIQVNFDKSIMMNSILAFGTFSESSFIRANFQGASLIEANFKDSNLFEANFTAANITNANFEGSNLNNATWADGKKCGLGSIGECKK